MITESLLKNSEKPSFIPFIVGGFPDLNATKDLLFCLQDNGASVIELGLPFSDPLADGPVIQKAANIALKSGTNVEKIFEMLDGIKSELKTPIVLFSYFNLLLNYGLEAFVKRAKEVNVSGFIVPDLPYEESAELKSLCDNAGLDLIMLVAPTSDKARIETIAKASSGFIYMVSSTGVTGVRDEFSQELKDVIASIKAVSDTPIAVGFGVSKPEHIENIKGLGVQGAIIGSAIIKIIMANQDDIPLVCTNLKNYIQEMF